MYGKLSLVTVACSIALFCCSGCVYDEANRCYLKEKLPPKQVSEVQILREAPQQPYTVIADLQAGRTYFWALVWVFEWDTSPKYMQKRAAEVGADAVIVVSAGGAYSRDEVWAGKDRHSDSQNRMLGTAIKYNTK
jgi:hypothetical protein